MYSVMVRDYTLINKPNKIVNNDGNMGQPWGIAFRGEANMPA